MLMHRGMSLLGNLMARVGFVKRSRDEKALDRDGQIAAVEPTEPGRVSVAPALSAAPALTDAKTVTPAQPEASSTQPAVAASACKAAATIVDDAQGSADDLTDLELIDLEPGDDDEWEWQAAAAH